MDRIEALVRCHGNGGELPLRLAGSGACEMIRFLVIARSEATKQSSFLSSAKKLDCFAPLAMTVQAASRLQERAEIRPLKSRPRLYFSPPFAHAGMFLRSYFVRRNF